MCTELLKGIESPSIICNQENFVLKGNAHKIRRALPDHHVFIKPAKKDKLEGRPVNGMFTAVSKKLKIKAKDVSPASDRIQGVLLEEEGDSILIVNVYFPADPKTKTYGGDEALENVLASIENLIQSHACNNVIIVGDMNTEMKRKNGRVARMEKFLSDNELQSAWEIFSVDFTHEFEKDEVTYTSTLDHIIWNTELKKSVVDSGVLHLASNTSDHHPIYCDVVRRFELAKDEPGSNGSKQGEISTKAMEESEWDRFTGELDDELSGIAVPPCVEETDGD